ncbi:MAG: hypothetical protein FJY85_24345, partial [Deltaproteobacteria bacterium]|nr:hypothetical protein [Deltaproteobacteria bacterium]
KRVEKLNDHGKWFNWQKGHTFDVLGLMHGLFPLQRVELAQHFPEMCGKSYLAVIHADGNAVGKRFNEWTESKGEKDPVRKEVIGEKFYYTMRVVVRKAVLAALRDTFPETLEVDFRPYQLLMLGGDDLVMVCKAEHALEFAYHYARHVERSGTNLPDESPLTVGIGIAIASANFPFYHLHTLAEQLASSAKRLYRSLPANARTSVVDWMVCTNSWSDDPQQQRKKAELISYHVPSANSTARNEQLALIRRPYTVLPGPEGSPNDLQSLEGLRLAAQSLSSSLKEADDRPARSQLRSLAMELYRGRLSGKLAFDELPQGTKKALEDVGIKKPWEEVTPDSNHWTTSLVDLVDLI